MSGHSKWSTIKRKKGVVDAKRGNIFTKLAKELTVSARLGGGDPDGNARLRLAIANAKSAQMPNDNIKRAILKGTGDLEGGAIEELSYEVYGVGGVAMIVEVATDNSTRTIADVRNIVDKVGGKMANPGSVNFLFTRRGVVRFDEAQYNEEQVMEAALEAGAEDVVAEGDAVIVYTSFGELHQVKETMEAKGLVPDETAIVMVPSTMVACDDEVARSTVKLIEKLEEHDDVQNVWANCEIDDAQMDAIRAS